MASKKLSAAILVISLLFYSTLSSACNSCNPTPTYSPPVAPTCNSCNPTPTYSPPVTPTYSPPVAPTPTAGASCPKDTLKLGVCVDLLGLINLQLGTPPTSNCCALLTGLTNLEAALCLCTAIKANVLGINLNVPVSLSLLLSACQKTVPAGFQCQ